MPAKLPSLANSLATMHPIECPTTMVRPGSTPSVESSCRASCAMVLVSWSWPVNLDKPLPIMDVY